MWWLYIYFPLNFLISVWLYVNEFEEGFYFIQNIPNESRVFLLSDLLHTHVSSNNFRQEVQSRGAKDLLASFPTYRVPEVDMKSTGLSPHRAPSSIRGIYAAPLLRPLRKGVFCLSDAG
jgi:hypothetical protein